MKQAILICVLSAPRFFFSPGSRGISWNAHGQLAPRLPVQRTTWARDGWLFTARSAVSCCWLQLCWISILQSPPNFLSSYLFAKSLLSSSQGKKALSLYLGCDWSDDTVSALLCGGLGRPGALHQRVTAEHWLLLLGFIRPRAELSLCFGLGLLAL